LLKGFNLTEKMMSGKQTKRIYAGNVTIGGGAPVSVQSMTSTKTENVPATVGQIKELEEAGCELVRVAVPGLEAADALGEIKKSIQIPLIADIHFDYKLALRAIENGADKVRINPGNIGSRDRVEKVLSVADAHGIPVRIGVNAGSLEKDIIRKHHGVTAAGLVESALGHVKICEKSGFENIVLSIKSSNVPLMIQANRMLAQKVKYPLHLGVTEAGTPRYGVLRSAVGIGILLAEGIGDTLRVSLTGNPVDEVKAGFEILKTLGLRKRGVSIISCPTCGRTEVNLVALVTALEKALSHIKKSVHIAVMGCAVNGPGEAKEADIGVACGKGSALLFRKGEVIRKIREDDIVDVMVKEVEDWEG